MVKKTDEFISNKLVIDTSNLSFFFILLSIALFASLFPLSQQKYLSSLLLFSIALDNFAFQTIPNLSSFLYWFYAFTLPIIAIESLVSLVSFLYCYLYCNWFVSFCSFSVLLSILYIVLTCCCSFSSIALYNISIPIKKYWSTFTPFLYCYWIFALPILHFQYCLGDFYYISQI